MARYTTDDDPLDPDSISTTDVEVPVIASNGLVPPLVADTLTWVEESWGDGELRPRATFDTPCLLEMVWPVVDEVAEAPYLDPEVPATAPPFCLRCGRWTESIFSDL